MTDAACRLVPLAEMVHGQEADLFVLLSGKESLTTRDGKPYVRVTFRDAAREVSFPIWDNSPWAAECRTNWMPGTCYKLRALYRDTTYGPQLEIRKMRPVVEADADDGFDRSRLVPHSRFEPETMFQELLAIVHERIADGDLRQLTESLLTEHRAELLHLPAARHRHHAYAGGWLEHTLSVTRMALALAEHCAAEFSDRQPPLDRSLVVAGAVLHDIGKLRELDLEAAEPAYTPAGELLGHPLLGRDLVREAAVELALDEETELRLEHLVLAHERQTEGGTPRPAMTAEALLLQVADELDAKLAMLYDILHDDGTAGPVTSPRNRLHQKLYRGSKAAGGAAGG